ncbi:histidine kinase N-terminal 7TM domain-containing protein [Saccharibacillus brassicae]|uniref:histidine kinase n=1 Tax=Saccharibacillus brassicae TaxID=2583377 RepID=A0A4Y6UXQ2_SACBS|nr:histidine kinase N-terminal 7TM domain-containing protein [Saccharibacillus brassicae]QDH21141.1 PAS domain-containing protein [Saccharibacillus brassicae]
MKYEMLLFALLIAATGCSLAMVALSWRRREFPIAVSYGLSMLASSFYTFGYAFELLADRLDDIRFWLRVEYVGIAFGTALWIMMVMQYTGSVGRLRARIVLPLLLVPLLTFVAHYTNPWTGWFYSSVSLVHVDGLALIATEKGPLYKLHIAYNYALIVAGMLLLVQMLLRAKPGTRKPIVFMIFGSLIAYIPSFVYVVGFLPLSIDLSPFGLVVAGIFYLWGIYQFNLLRLAPLALRRVFASMPDAVLLFGPDDRLIGFNPSARQMLPGLGGHQIGLSPEEVLAAMPALSGIVRTGAADFRQRAADGGDGHYDVRFSTLRDRLQRPAGSMVLLTDIGEAVRAERRILDDSAKLEQLNTFKDKMFQVVAHDLRDPLAVLVNLAELLEEESEDRGSRSEVADEIGRQIRGTFALIEGLLDWLRSQGGGMAFHPMQRDLPRTVERHFDRLRHRGESKRLTLRSSVRAGTLVYADKEMLDLVLRNLLSNAIKFTEEGGTIEVGARLEADRCVVYVRDTGSGMPPERAAALLRETYPVSETGTAGERGIGLGLSLCRSFLRLNGGDIWFDSQLDLGSTFYFSLPVSPAEDQEGGEP